MFNIRTYNNISEKGLSRFPGDHYEISDTSTDPDALLLRSHKLSVDDATENLVEIGIAHV